MSENKLVDYSIDFSVDALNLTEKITGHYAIKNQFERSSTSIGANIHEANYARSKADFASKLSIALSECYESEYWLKVMYKSKLIDVSDFNDLIAKSGTLRRLLISSINTVKNNDK